MSYSFAVRGDSKTAAILAAEAKFRDEVLAQQPIHSTDQGAAFANLRTHMDLLREPNADEVVDISMHGSVWVENGEVKSAGSGCSVSVGRKPAASA